MQPRTSASLPRGLALLALRVNVPRCSCMQAYLHLSTFTRGSLSAEVCFYFFFDRIVQVRRNAHIFAGLVEHRHDILVDAHAVVDVRSFDDLGLESLDVVDLDPEIGAHALRAVDALGIAQKQGVLAVVSVEAAEGDLAVLRFRGDRARMIKCQRVGQSGHRLKIAIEQAREYGMLGKQIMGSDFDFDIEIRYGAGAFVCGEETALIHSMEGKRGEPTLKPPFPAESGYMGYPTNVNNVETLANVPIILTKGADWFASIGTEKSKGTKVFALAGKINNVGLIEVPMGTTLREIIYDIGGGVKNGKKFKAVQTGGPSGGCLTEKHLDIPIDYESLGAAGSMMGSGGMIVMDEDDCMVSVAKFYLEFTVGESCGKCTPCRIGNKRMLEILTRITEGKGTMDDIDHLKSLAATIKDTALCGLGQTSPNPILSTIDNFYDEYVEHVKQHTCRAKQCKALLTYTVNPDKCKGCGACARNCPADAIMGDVRKPHVINPFKCIRCGMCQSRCRFDAIQIF